MIDNIFFNNKNIEEALSAEGYGILLESSFLEKLKGISYLSTIDMVFNNAYRFSRYDHSIGTAYVALLLSKHLNLTKTQRDALVLANLIHDIGHVAFSHASENLLLEYKRKYHTGMLKMYLRNYIETDRYDSNLIEYLPVSDSTKQLIIDLSYGISCTDDILNTLHYSPINCDKIDGTTRSLFGLGEKIISPSKLIEMYIWDGNEIAINSDSIPDIIQFWEQKSKLFSQYVHSPRVIAMEAMLTRALDIAIETDDDINAFVIGSDEDLLEIIRKNKDSAEMLKDIENKELFSSLEHLHPDIFEEYKHKFKGNRLNIHKRKQLESTIANELDVKAKHLISYFTFKKTVFILRYHLLQLNLFDKPSIIRFPDFKAALQKRKKYGEIFNIYFKKG